MEPLPVAGSISFTKDAPVAQLTCNGSRLLLARSGDVTDVNPDFLSLLLESHGRFESYPRPKFIQL